jgi:hypothetical protein
MTAGCPGNGGILQARRQRPSPDTTLLGLYFQQPARCWHRRHTYWHWLLGSSRLGKRRITKSGIGCRRAVGLFILLIIQVPFELRSKTDTDFFSAEYTVDRSKPQIRAWKYPSDVAWRIGQEIGASDALAQSNPGAFKDDLGKLTDDMTIWSVASYMFADQFDWQLRKVRARGPTVGTFTTTEPLSNPVECTLFSRAQIAEKLASAGNAFANSGRFIREQLCLPPGSSVDIRAKSFAITNPFVHISFTLESTGGVRYGKPGTAGVETPSGADGGQQYETRVNSLRANVEYSWIIPSP